MIFPSLSKSIALALLATKSIVSAFPIATQDGDNDYPSLTKRENAGVFGYASLNGSTTGGASGESVTATSLKELQSYCAQDGPLTIYVSGGISGSADVVHVSSDKSVIGKSGASLTNIGLSIKDVSNVIIQNLIIGKFTQIEIMVSITIMV
ncbi:unnamed protein product [Ambrosiozyma monospora]|uniref:Unnamed protein product n=1 Tax=Ambrosiozyma monospora TaxID=43982 RepID=A0ACB5UA38_AMBMO|nr:unnamed protein product [Ambrosiozyma monospora]